MSFVVTLTGLRPPRRFPPVLTPWTQAVVEEAPDPIAGAWTPLDAIDLAPVDSDPTEPQRRDFTITNAALEAGWYRVRWRDAGGNEDVSAVMLPGVLGSLPPSTDELRDESPLLSEMYPGDPYDSSVELALERVRNDAVGQVQSMSARILDPAHPERAATTYGVTCEPTPQGLVPVAVRAIALMAEAMAVTKQPKLARQAASRLRLRGFSAGPYSEQYWDPAMVRGAKGAGSRPQFVDNPDLDDALWALATVDARNQLIAWTTGVQPPAAMGTAFDYTRPAGRGY